MIDTLQNQSAYTVEAAIEALAGVGISLPTDTTADNFVERLMTVLVALQGADEARKKQEAADRRSGGLALGQVEIGGRLFNSVKEIPLDTGSGELSDEEADRIADRQLVAAGLSADKVEGLAEKQLRQIGQLA